MKIFDSCSASFTCYLGLPVDIDLCDVGHGARYQISLAPSYTPHDYREMGIDYSDELQEDVARLCREHTGRRFESIGSVNGYVANVLCEYPGDAPTFDYDSDLEVLTCY